MATTQLRAAIRMMLHEASVRKGRVSAGRDYAAKERVRESLQGVLLDAVEGGDVDSEESRAAWFDAADMALKALRAVPFAVLSKLPRD